MAHLYLAIGARSSGKTTCLSELWRLMNKPGCNPCAIIEENSRDALGFPVRIFFRDMESGRSVLLASRPSSSIPFSFDEGAFAWAGERLREAHARQAKPIIVDELGPLELEDSGGLRPYLDLLLKTHPGPLVFSLRPSLLPAIDELARNLGMGRWVLHTVQVEAFGSHFCAERLFRMLEAHCHRAEAKI
ncbi:MAG TPA: hypothetical protein VIO60_10250 [Rectinemataceae bacterium]